MFSLLTFVPSLHAHEQIFTDSVNNPLSGEYGVEELLEAFSEQVRKPLSNMVSRKKHHCVSVLLAKNFDDVCVGHLFTYRDYQGLNLYTKSRV